MTEETGFHEQEPDETQSAQPEAVEDQAAEPAPADDQDQAAEPAPADDQDQAAGQRSADDQDQAAGQRSADDQDQAAAVEGQAADVPATGPEASQPAAESDRAPLFIPDNQPGWLVEFLREIERKVFG